MFQLLSRSAFVRLSVALVMTGQQSRPNSFERCDKTLVVSHGAPPPGRGDVPSVRHFSYSSLALKKKLCENRLKRPKD